MKYKNLKWINLGSIIIFTAALCLNVQSGFDKGIEVIGIPTIAQGTGSSGSGGSGSGGNYYPVAVKCRCWDSSMNLVTYGYHTICPSGSEAFCTETVCPPPPNPSNCWNNDNY